MTSYASPERKAQFRQDVNFLKENGIRQNVVATRMGMAAANFSRYLNSDNPGKDGKKRTHQITDDFLHRFYDAWGGKLDELRGTQDQVAPSISQSRTVEEPEVFVVKNYKDELLDSLRKNNTALIHGFDKATTTFQVLADNNKQALDNITKLVDSNRQLVETNNQLVQAQLELMRDQRRGPGSPREGV